MTEPPFRAYGHRTAGEPEAQQQSGKTDGQPKHATLIARTWLGVLDVAGPTKLILGIVGILAVTFLVHAVIRAIYGG